MTEKQIFYGNLVNSMREYQKIHGIKGQCMTNVQYLFDCFKENKGFSAKAKAVIAVSTDETAMTTEIITGHLVIVLNDNLLLEPSYEIYSKKKIKYFYNIKHFKSAIAKKSIDLKICISNHIVFIKLAERINNGELMINDKTFYDDQADYIEKVV
jgi:hypothetical protein